MTPLEKLLSRAIRLDSGCLVLPNHLDNPKVYPYVYLEKGKTARANRLVYEHEHGPTKSLICHTCDYPRCFALEHLFAGSHQDNMRDMAEKGRAHTLAGPENPRWQGGNLASVRRYQATLTPEQQARRREQGREALRRWRARRTPEQVEEERRKNRDRNRAHKYNQRKEES